MKIELKKLKLDKDNPRFITSFGKVSDEIEIYDYLAKYEKLDELKSSIVRAGFYQIGERVVVKKTEGDTYIVLEGNRRVCALKDLHGFYRNEKTSNQQILEDTLEIEVDIITNEDDIQPFLSIRHIDGVRKWSPESRRLFYYRHFENNKTITQIEQMTQQPVGEIKKFVREQFFLDYFKSVVGESSITTPSLIYERIYRYSIDLKLINEIEIKNDSLYRDTKVTPTLSILDKNDLNLFYKELFGATFNKEKDKNIINSRTINKLNDFKILLANNETKELFPELFRLMKLINQKNLINEFIPHQKINNSIRGGVPSIPEIIEYKIIKDSATVKVFHKEEEISIENFIDGEPGNYIIDIDGKKFPFIIKPYAQPQIIATQTINFELGKGYNLSNDIIIYNHKEERVEFDKKYFVLPNELSLNGKELRASIAGNYIVEIKFLHKDKDVEYSDSKRVKVVVSAQASEVDKIEHNKQYFNFKVIDFNQATSYIINSKLFDEIEYAYKQQHFYIFITALRSLLDLYIIEFHERSKNSTNINIWKNINSVGEIRNRLASLENHEINLICIKYIAIKKREGVKLNYHEIKNYFEANLSNSNVRQVIGTLHLGAHTSLKNLNVANIALIQPLLTSLIEFLFVLEKIDFNW